MFGDDLIKYITISECIHDPSDEGELELHEVSLQIRKPRTCDIRCTLFIDPASYLCDLCVILDWEVELANLSPLLDHHILLFCETDRCIYSWDIRDTLIESEELTFDFLIFRFERLDFFFYRFCLFEDMRLWFTFTHTCREIIATSTQNIEVLPECDTSYIEIDDLVEVDSLHDFIM